MGSVVAASVLESTGSIVVAHRLGCSTACGIFLDQRLTLSSALAGGFFTTEYQGSQLLYFYK